MVRIGRNAPCPCGSGKKYKHCCIKKPKSTSAPSNPALESKKYNAAFINSVCDKNDALALTAIIKQYKELYPDHMTQLYDSVGIAYYYDMPEWIDMSFPASEHLYASPLVENIRTIDPEMADNYQGVTLGKLGANRLVVTHSHHNRNYGPSEYLFPMEFDTFLADTLEDNFTSLELKLKTGFEEEVGKIIQPLQEDEKPLIGISTYMGAKPETALDGDICNFLPWMEALSKHLAEKYEARILFCGDFLPQRAWSKFTDTTFVDVNNLTQNPYFQIEIMRRTQWFLGTWSPFWESVNLMRTPADTPAIQLLTSPLVYQGRVRPETRNYYTIGGRWDLPYVQATFRHPILKDWIDKRSFDTDSITDIMDNLQANSKSDNTG